MPSLNQLRILSSGKETFVTQNVAVAASTGQAASTTANPAQVTSVFGRTGAVVLTLADVIAGLGYAPVSPTSPIFLGTPTAPMPPLNDNSSALATTAWVKEQAGFGNGLVITAVTNGLYLSPTGVLSSLIISVFGRTGAILMTASDVISSLSYVPASIDSPIFTGSPTAPTALTSDASNALATTAFVKNAIPAQAGLVIANIGLGLALTAGNLTANVDSVFGRSGQIVLTAADITTALSFAPAPIASPALTGTPTTPTAGLGDNSGTVASTAFVQASLASFTQLANVQVIGAGLTLITGTLSATVLSVFGRSGNIVLTASDVALALTFTPAPLNSPVFSGIPAAPTPIATDNSTSLATTAFVQNLVQTASPLLIATIGSGLTLTSGTLSSTVTSVFGRTGSILLTASDVTTALSFIPAPLISPALTGTPTAPTQLSSDNSTRLATTAYVRSLLSANAVGYAQLPIEVQQLPLGFVIAGRPPANQPYYLVMAMAVTLPANLAGTVIYCGSVATANAVFTINKISSGTTTMLGAITVTAASHTSATLSTQTQASLAIGDVLQLVGPPTQDVTLSDLGITILCAKV
jgi:hypothetical protein